MTPWQALLIKDWRMWLNWRRVLREQSRFKVIFVTTFGLGLMAGLWWMFYSGFQLLASMGGIGALVIRHLFALFYLGLGLMLVLSNVITAYTVLFRSPEIHFLLLRPISHGTIVLNKLVESSSLSSWAFFCVIIPFVGAFAWHEGLSLWFVAWTLMLSLPFVALCAELGMLAAILAVRWLPRFRPWLWVSIIFVPLAIAAFWYYRPVMLLESNDTMFLLSRLTPGIKLASQPFLPCWWVAEGIRSLARHQWLRGMLFSALLLANVLFFGLLLERIGQKIFYPGWLKSDGNAGRRTRQSSFFTHAMAWLIFLAPGDRALVQKDLRLLLRDPAQWTQGLIFFGLLAVYFFNLRFLRYDQLPPIWHNFIAFLNVLSLSAIMCSFCARFVYPLMSLEGQGIWLLGLSPVLPARALLVKFGLASVFLVVVGLVLTIISGVMLKVNWVLLGTAALLIVAMALALCGLATGLGAIFLDLKQKNTVAIVSGFGGTLNLALSLGYMLAAVLPFGMLFHLRALGQTGLHVLWHDWLLAAGWLLLITAATVAIPLALGRRSLRLREY